MELGFKHWRFEAKKLILLMVVTTTIGAVLLPCVLPHPTSFWSRFFAVTVPPYKVLNNKTQIVEPLPSNYSEQFARESVPLNASVDHVMSTSPQAVVSINFVRSNTTVAAHIPSSKDGCRTSDVDDVGYTANKNNSTGKKCHVPETLADVTEETRLSDSLVNSAREDLNEKNSTSKTSSSHIQKVEKRTPQATFYSEGGHTATHTKEVLRLTPQQTLVYAKHEIMNAPLVTDDPELHPPVFRNVSMFRRSYELMEKILKVYIYPDGQKPIFHEPLLKGIYASEGWFMKLMEENRQFVVKDPEKAHLFYLPYSSLQLEIGLYVHDSHNMRPLSIYLRDYVIKIASKYRFWNRTSGADHFLVACHDWGPYTTKEHKELRYNTIKALCNADVSEGVFIPGRDVSLPETNIQAPRNPLRGLGGKHVSQRTILAFFAGKMHGRVRPVLLKYWENKDEDMKIYGPLPKHVSRKMSYIQHMKSSKYCICPMGYEVNSPRIIEAIYYGCVPVIIADNFVLPFNEILNWSACSITVAEKDIPKLKDILRAIPFRKYMAMQMNVKKVQKHFLWHRKPIKYDIFYMILHSIWFNRLNQIVLNPV